MTIIHTIIKTLKSFVYAGRGILNVLSERNMRIHLLVAIFVIAVGVVVGYTSIEWIVILFAIGIVMAAETFNTAIEDVCNHMRDDLGLSYEGSQRARDLAAGAVLILAGTSVIIWVIIMLPKVLLA